MTSQSSLYKTDAEGNVIQSGYPHIVFKNTGAPMIEGTRIKVQVIAIANQTWHLTTGGHKARISVLDAWGDTLCACLLLGPQR